MTVQRILNTQPKRTTTPIAPGATIAQVLQSPEFKDTGALGLSLRRSSAVVVPTSRMMCANGQRQGLQLLADVAQKTGAVQSVRIDLIPLEKRK